MNTFTPERYAALVEAKRIAETKHLIQEMHDGRWLFGFDASPCLFVIAPHDTSPLGLAILIIEQLAITNIQHQVMQEMQSISRLQGMDAIGRLQ